MNKQRFYQDIKNCTLFTAGIGFLAGVQIQIGLDSREQEFTIPLLLTGFGATAGFTIGLSISLIAEVHDWIINKLNENQTQHHPFSFQGGPS